MEAGHCIKTIHTFVQSASQEDWVDTIIDTCPQGCLLAEHPDRFLRSSHFNIAEKNLDPPSKEEVENYNIRIEEAGIILLALYPQEQDMSALRRHSRGDKELKRIAVKSMFLVGYSKKEIAKVLCIADSTIRYFITAPPLKSSK